jgi:hypothetical protein
MNRVHKDLKELSIGNLFASKEMYVIPIYQRNYSWGKPQIEQLVEDIWDYAFAKADSETSYFIGNLIVFNREQRSSEVIFETIDGQQRLTTLTIMMAVLHQEFGQKKISEQPILLFDSRKQSQETLEHIYRSENKEEIHGSTTAISSRMLDAYDFIYKKIKELEKRPDNSVNQFVNYLLNKVIILRVSVPQETDLNHYFEIMNNRGEQLEKHEILKAQLLSYLQAPENASDKDKKQALADTLAFQTIWEGCEEMEKYIQYGFNPDHRKELFTTDWNKFDPIEFEDVSKLFLQDKTPSESNSVAEGDSLEKVLKPNYNIQGNNSSDWIDKEEPPERFSSIINFSNFLLHVLRVQVNNYDANEIEITDQHVPLDDKRLVEIFEEEINDFQYGKPNEYDIKETRKEFVKTFAFQLLKAKFCFDQYILKREISKEEWSLKTLGTASAGTAKYTNTFKGNSDILMLLSMFHVSYPARLYKHWLNGVLNYTMKNDMCDAVAYKLFLERFANQILFDRYLSPVEALDYHEMIYNNQEVMNQNPQFDNINKGTQVENFVFNYLDYLLWKGNSIGSNGFQFAFRNSVEHYYPQNPKNEERIKTEDIAAGVDNFGNLCLVTRSQNSSLSNKEDWQKKLHYNGQSNISLKHRLMMESAQGKWDVFKIEEHLKEMKSVFEKIIN